MAERWAYIVVGAGSAGAVVASRLSEDPGVRVLLLEAGPNYPTAATPAMLRGRLKYREAVDRHPELWWPDLRARRSAVQEPRAYGRGRGVGGSSAVNGMFAVRGAPEDFDLWAAGGAEGWSYADVLPALMRLEDELDFPERDFHGRGGPIPIAREPEDRWGALDVALREAAAEAGYGWAPDHNDPGATGASPFAFTIRNGLRVSTNDGYLEPARGRANLCIKGDVLVDSVLFGSDGTTARGVRSAAGAEYRLDSGGEVVLCAGAVHSPAILMRSGIGPEELLRRLDIVVRGDLPVGRTLQEHPMITVPIAVAAGAAESGRSPMVCLRYSSGLAGAGRNDMMVLTGGGYKVQGAGRPSLGGMRLWAMQAFSNGTLRLVDRDPARHPAVDLGLLGDDRDLDRMADGLARLADLLAIPALARLLTTRPELPARRDLPALVGDGYTGHISSTCPIGRPGDGRAVLDPACRVIGLDGLRVIDASSMPHVPRANIHLSVVMLAEHAVDRMRKAAAPVR